MSCRVEGAVGTLCTGATPSAHNNDPHVQFPLNRHVGARDSHPDSQLHQIRTQIRGSALSSRFAALSTPGICIPYEAMPTLYFHGEHGFANEESGMHNVPDLCCEFGHRAHHDLRWRGGRAGGVDHLRPEMGSGALHFAFLPTSVSYNYLLARLALPVISPLAVEDLITPISLRLWARPKIIWLFFFRACVSLCVCACARSCMGASPQ